MRPALQRLLRSPSALGDLRNALESPLDLSFGTQVLSRCRPCYYGLRSISLNKNSARFSTVEENAGENHGLRFKVYGHGSISIWKQRLTTFEQYQHESDLGNPTANGSDQRLVDSPEHATNFGIWLELVRFRQRHYDLNGLGIIWKEILRRELQLPCRGTIANGLWSSLLQLGFRTPEVLKEIEVYAKKQRELTGDAWPELYVTILRHHLNVKPRYAYQWHSHLHKDFPPTLEQLKELFRHAVTSEDSLRFFRPIYIELGIRQMYDTIVPELCERQQYAAALKWHNLLLRKHDLPSNASVSKPLLHHIAIYGKHDHLVEITKGMVEAGVPFTKTDRTTYRRPSFISRELMNRQLGETHRVPPKIFSDYFCARLFATKMFTIDIVINGLRVLGVEAIGPLSLREIGLREQSKTEAVCSRIDELASAGISIGNSNFSMLVRRLALEEKRGLLKDVFRCDLHPDTFEDRNLQESLLVSYHHAGDKRRTDRTLAILTVNSPHKNLATDYWNLMLRVYLTRRDLKGIQQTLNTMREMHLVVSPRSSSYVRVCMLSRRQVGRLPYRTNDLPFVINIWREILQLGGRVPPIAWREILKRLGMSGQLGDFEALSLWLADWYSDPAARASQACLASPKVEDKHVSRSGISAILSPQHHLHPLRVLFPHVMQQAIVTWGFQRSAKVGSNRDFSSGGLRNRLSWTWGLQLLQKLRQRKVIVARSTVAKICRERLTSLFGPGVSNRKRNRRARQMNTNHLGHYLDGINEIWGANLSREVDSLPANLWHRRSRLGALDNGQALDSAHLKVYNSATLKIT